MQVISRIYRFLYRSRYIYTSSHTNMYTDAYKDDTDSYTVSCLYTYSLQICRFDPDIQILLKILIHNIMLMPIQTHIQTPRHIPDSSTDIQTLTQLPIQVLMHMFRFHTHIYIYSHTDIQFPLQSLLHIIVQMYRSPCSFFYRVFWFLYRFLYICIDSYRGMQIPRHTHVQSPLQILIHIHRSLYRFLYMYIYTCLYRYTRSYTDPHT